MWKSQKEGQGQGQGQHTEALNYAQVGWGGGEQRCCCVLLHA